MMIHQECQCAAPVYDHIHGERLNEIAMLLNTHITQNIKKNWKALRLCATYLFMHLIFQKLIFQS